MFLAIAAAGIAQGLRCAQLHRQMPAAACDQACTRLRIVLVPGDAQATITQGLRLRGIVIDHEFEAGAARFVHGQFDDATAQLQRFAFQRTRDPLMQCMCDMQPGEGETEHEDPGDPQPAIAHRHDNADKQRHREQGPRRQDRQPQAGADAGQQCNRGYRPGNRHPRWLASERPTPSCGLLDRDAACHVASLCRGHGSNDQDDARRRVGFPRLRKSSAGPVRAGCRR